VDAATQVIRTTKEALLQGPALLTQEEAAYTGEVFKDDEGRLFMLLDLTKILSPQERRQLTAAGSLDGSSAAPSAK
jgi:chemotaxis signal transduction protein